MISGGKPRIIYGKGAMLIVKGNKSGQKEIDAMHALPKIEQVDWTQLIGAEIKMNGVTFNIEKWEHRGLR